jgi:hypothetical protein
MVLSNIALASTLLYACDYRTIVTQTLVSCYLQYGICDVSPVAPIVFNAWFRNFENQR